jgi:hypothetical protein
MGHWRVVSLQCLLQYHTSSKLLQRSNQTSDFTSGGLVGSIDRGTHDQQMQSPKSKQYKSASCQTLGSGKMTILTFVSACEGDMTSVMVTLNKKNSWSSRFIIGKV